MMALALLALSAAPGGAGEPSLPFTVLEGRHAQTFSRQCSRAPLPVFQGTWQPGEEDIKALEEQLPAVEGLKASICCIKDARVGSVHDYYRQYVGIVVNGRKLIYINAFARRLTEYGYDWWRRKPALACEGGEAFWGVLYDPLSQSFSQLAFNGVQ